MNDGILQRAVTVVNPQGLHMRPATVFAKAAQRFHSAVTVRRDDKSVNGKSPLDLLLLAAEPGVQLVIEIAGDDAQEAMAALESILEVADWDAVGDAVAP